jgi:hypothetical protein
MRVCKFKVKRSDRQTNAFLRRCLVSMGVARDWRMNWNRRIYGMTVRRSCRQRRQIPRAHYDCAIRNGYGSYGRTMLLGDGATRIKNMKEAMLPDA